jgi:tRNA threonylcarbamoyl adenosine modification protein YeaZ
MPEAVLALDTGSPIVSVAVAERGELLASRATRLERSSTQILGLIDETLRACGLRPSELAGILAVRGPGSFTGLRIALATALGLHQALGIPATALSSFQALAAAAASGGGPVLAVVDALRGEWVVQLFPDGDPGLPAGEPRSIRCGSVPEPEAFADFAAEPWVATSGRARLTVVGFDLDPLRKLTNGSAGAVRFIAAGTLEAGGLAAPAARWFTGTRREPEEWDCGLLSAPIYSRPPAVTTPKPPRRSGAPA